MKTKVNLFLVAILSTILFTMSCKEKIQEVKLNQNPTTFCNPMNLDYRFCLDTPSRREAADPSMIQFKNEYYLFASKSGGYWHSKDMKKWSLINTTDLPIEDYAPAVVAIGDEMYFMASGGKPIIYKTKTPENGKWEVVNSSFPINMIDPDLFLDDDGRLYFYYGCSNVNPIYGVELDLKNNLNPKGKSVECLNSHIDSHGWEQPGDYNDKSVNPWIEGAWMTKHNGKYYLQYATPGTEYKSYSDGVYVSNNPLGPFEYQNYSPFSHKPEGFAAGAGHSSTFLDVYGNFWHISTMTISIKHMFERRLGMFPTFFDKDNQLFTYTGFGDYPMLFPSGKTNSPKELFPEWMLLSYKKKVKVSSYLEKHIPENAVNEDIRTYWSAKTSNAGEWLEIDLEKEYTVNSIQINFAEQNTKAFGKTNKKYQQYILEFSTDGKNWQIFVDKSKNQKDIPHDYLELLNPIHARYFKITNVQTAAGGNFAISGLRIFGKGNGEKPHKVNNFKIERNKDDERIVRLKWDSQENVTGYNISYGTAKDKLYQNYIVYDKNELVIKSLNKGVEYFFEVKAFNENGVGE